MQLALVAYRVGATKLVPQFAGLGVFPVDSSQLNLWHAYMHSESPPNVIRRGIVLDEGGEARPRVGG